MDSNQVPSKPNAPLPGQKAGHGISKLMVREKPEDRRRKYIVRGAVAAIGGAACLGAYVIMGSDNAYRTCTMVASGLVGLGGLASVVAGLAEDYGSGSL